MTRIANITSWPGNHNRKLKRIHSCSLYQFSALSWGINTDMSTVWSNELSSCWSAYWLCDSSPDCNLAFDASVGMCVLPRKLGRKTNKPAELMGRIASAVGINGLCPLICLAWSQVLPGTGAIGRSYLRTKVRQAKGIDGNRCTDCLTHCICGPCALYQEAKELNIGEVVAEQPKSAWRIAPYCVLGTAKTLTDRPHCAYDCLL